MQQVDATIKQTIRNTVITNALILVIVTLMMDQPMPYALGILFGALFGVLAFVELAITLNKSVTMSPGKASQYVTLKYFMRFLLTATVLVVSILSPYVHIIGTIMGLLSIKLVIYITNLFNSTSYFKKIFARKEE